jgi:hypothetical protein
MPAPAALKGPFTSRPGKYIEAEFRDWVGKTGQPDTWRYHEPSTPPRDQDFEELLRFEIPEKKRAEVGKASCPICSPYGPKYFEGALAWFPVEGCLRAIGHECAKRHFGAARHNASIAITKHRKSVENAQDFLLEVLPKISHLRAEVATLEPVADVVDRVRNLFWLRSSKASCARLARLGGKGVLAIEETREISVVDTNGREQTRLEPEVVASFRVRGLSFLTRKYSVLAQARNTAIALEKVRAADEEEVLKFVCDDLANDEYLFEAEKLARAAVREIEKLREAINEARAFLSSANLTNLSQWSTDRRAGAPVMITIDPRHASRVRVRCPGRPGHEFPIPECLR